MKQLVRAISWTVMYFGLILALRTTGSGWNDSPGHIPNQFERVELAGLLFALLSLLVSVVTSLVALVSIVASIASRNGGPSIRRLLHLLLWPRVALLCGLLIHYGAILYASYADATVMTFAEPELQMSLPLFFAILLVLDIGINRDRAGGQQDWDTILNSKVMDGCGD